MPSAEINGNPRAWVTEVYLVTTVVSLRSGTYYYLLSDIVMVHQSSATWYVTVPCIFLVIHRAVQLSYAGLRFWLHISHAFSSFDLERLSRK